jgi:predicted Zn-dependent peptidase
MFEGSENVVKNEHSGLISQNGGSDNATTDNDRTLYYETLPANQLDLGLFLEADRMGKLSFSQETLDNQRNAVQEERRLRVDNQPYGKTYEAIDDLAFDSFAYKHSVIGSMDDLNAASLQDVKDFFKRYYAPNNATIAIVGDFNSDEAIAKVKKYFESIPSQPAPPKPDISQPAQTAERRKQLEDQLAQLPRIDIVYRIPAGDNPDYYPLDVMSRILSSGQYDEVARLQTQLVEDWEMDKVRMVLRRNQVSSAQSTLGRAANLAEYYVEFGDANLVNIEYQKLAAVTKADIQRVAKKYLVETNRSVIITLPKPKPAAPAGQ